MKKRVVITGIGAITPIGNNINDFWSNLQIGKNGISEITLFDTEKFNIKLAAESDIDLNSFLQFAIQSTDKSCECLLREFENNLSIISLE